MTLPAFAVERRCLPHDTRSYRSIPAADAGAQQQTPPAAVAALGRWDRRTDGRTSDRYIDPAPHTIGQR